MSFLFSAYTVGAVANHSLTLAVHEIGHNLAFSKHRLNRWIGFVANFPLILPMSITFRDYHSDHHRFQGVAGYDVDLPSELEGMLLNNFFTKLFFCTFQVFFYTLRPMTIRPPKMEFYYFVNFATQFGFDFVVWYFFGFGPLFYMGMGMILAGSLHPLAGHFLAEHYVFGAVQETYSYYGVMNMFSYNAGYHVEHHDFPNIPWSRIRELRDLAPEFYDKLYFHKSWAKVLYHFLMDKHVSPRYRIKRREKYVNEFFRQQEKEVHFCDDDEKTLSALKEVADMQQKMKAGEAEASREAAEAEANREEEQKAPAEEAPVRKRRTNKAM